MDVPVVRRLPRLRVVRDAVIYVLHKMRRRQDTFRIRGFSAHPIQQMAGEDGIVSACASTISNQFIGFSCRDYLSRNSLKHVTDEPLSATFRPSLNRKPAVTSIHYKQDMLCWDDFCTTS